MMLSIILKRGRNYLEFSGGKNIIFCYGGFSLCFLGVQHEMAMSKKVILFPSELQENGSLINKNLMFRMS